jgi:hypothetical protein
MSELSPESRSLLASLAAAHDPPDDAAARVRAAMTARLAAPPPPRRWPWAAGVSVAIGVLAVALSRRPAPAPTPVMSAPAVAVTAAPPPPARVASPPPAAVVETPAVVAPAPTPRRPAVTAEDPMLAELRAVQTAQRALARHDSAAALRTLTALDRTQPQGNLREERDALRVLALCAAGRADDARAAAAVFLSRHPGSPQAARVQGACR